jgi:hypothetical protein
MMTDPLAERFLSLVDGEDDSEWLDVRRRARRSSAIVFIVVVAAASVLAAAALSARDTWVFGFHWGQPTANRTVTLHGRTYSIRLSLLDKNGQYFGLVLAGQGADAKELTAVYNGAVMRVPSEQRHADAVAATNYRHDGGEIWYGDARKDVRRVVVVDTRGHAVATDTVAAPSKLRTEVRFWAVALESSYARALVVYDGDGNVVQRTRLVSMMRFG